LAWSARELFALAAERFALEFEERVGALERTEELQEEAELTDWANDVSPFGFFSAASCEPGLKKLVNESFREG